MDAIRLRQINEALGYDKTMNSMVWEIGNRRVSRNPEPTTTPYSQIDAAVVKMVDQAADQLRSYSTRNLQARRSWRDLEAM